MQRCRYHRRSNSDLNRNIIVELSTKVAPAKDAMMLPSGILESWLPVRCSPWDEQDGAELELTLNGEVLHREMVFTVFGE